MGTLYANAAELLAEVNENGVTIRRWNSDFTEIIMKTPEELQADWDTLLLNTKNAHGILLYKLEGGVVVPRTQQEIDADEVIYYSNNFSWRILIGRMLETYGDVWVKNHGTQTANLQGYCDWQNWAGIRTVLNLMVTDLELIQDEVNTIVGLFAEQNVTIP